MQPICPKVNVTIVTCNEERLVLANSVAVKAAEYVLVTKKVPLWKVNVFGVEWICIRKKGYKNGLPHQNE